MSNRGAFVTLERFFGGEEKKRTRDRILVDKRDERRETRDERDESLKGAQYESAVYFVEY